MPASSWDDSTSPTWIPLTASPLPSPLNNARPQAVHAPQWPPEPRSTITCACCTRASAPPSHPSAASRSRRTARKTYWTDCERSRPASGSSSLPPSTRKPTAPGPSSWRFYSSKDSAGSWTPQAEPMPSPMPSLRMPMRGGWSWTVWSRPQLTTKAISIPAFSIPSKRPFLKGTARAKSGLPTATAKHGLSPTASNGTESHSPNPAPNSSPSTAPSAPAAGARALDTSLASTRSAWCPIPNSASTTTPSPAGAGSAWANGSSASASPLGTTTSPSTAPGVS